MTLRLFFVRFAAGCWVSALLFSAHAVGGAPVAVTLTSSDLREQQREVRLIVDMLQTYHYSDRQFRELENGEIIDRYLHTLDPGATILTRDEVDFLHRRFGRSLKTVYLLRGDVLPAFEMFDYFRDRARARLAWIDERLGRELDLATDGTLPLPREAEAKPAADKSEADARWEARLANGVIAARLDGRDPAAAVEHVRDQYRRWGRRIAAIDAIAVRECFLETLIELFDPHSGYFSAESADEFTVEMRGAIGGAGLDIEMDASRCLVAGVLPGGPAEAEGSVLPGDEILAAAEMDGPWTELHGKRLRDIVALLRGATGSKLRLACRPAGTEERREVTLTRQEVVLLDHRARGAVIDLRGDDGATLKIGWISVPAFYAAEDGSDSSSVTRDVREILEQLKSRLVAAVVVDLRGNPGGAMTEAVSFCGLFQRSGTVLLTRGMDGEPNEQTITPAEPVYTGPLVVLTSRESASASEIVAGALQYHRRAVIVGAPATFGKGTVQSYIDLNHSPARGAAARLPWGTLRLTTQRFYFPDGRSPQRIGAAADIVVPMAPPEDFAPEAELPHALAAEVLSRPAPGPEPEGVCRVDAGLLATLKSRAAQRGESAPEFALERRREELNHERARRPAESLNLTKREAEQAANDAIRERWVDERRTFMAGAAWRAEPVDTEAVAQALAAHAARIRAHRPAEAVAGEGWLWGGAFYADSTDGRLRGLPLGRIVFRDYEAQAAQLAAACASRSGAVMTAERMVAVLRELQILERRSDAAVLACFWRAAGPAGSLEAGPLRRGVAAVLQVVTEIDPALLDPSRSLDVAYRESVRIAADWAALIPARGATPASPPVAGAASAP